jgi:hypothetical protein
MTIACVVQPPQLRPSSAATCTGQILVTGSGIYNLPHLRNALQTNGAVRSIVRKKAATCLLRLIRKSPAEAEILQPDVWSVKLVRCHPLFVVPDVLA